MIKAKFSKLLDRAEDPGETLDYSYEKQLELLQNVKRGVADVVTAKKRLQLQTDAARAEPRQARRAGAPGAGGRPRGSRASGARAQVRRPAAAPGARPQVAELEAAAGEARRVREAAFGQDRGVPLAEGGHQGAVLRRRGAGADRRGGDGDRRADGRHRARDPAGEGQDRADDRRAPPRSTSSIEAGTLEDFTPATRRSSTASWRSSPSQSQVDQELATMKAELGAGGEQAKELEQ